MAFKIKSSRGKVIVGGFKGGKVVKKNSTRITTPKNNNKKLYTKAVSIKTGKEYYVVDGKLKKSKPILNKSRSSNRNTSSRSSGKVTVSITNTKTGVRTNTVQDINTGKLISSKKKNLSVAERFKNILDEQNRYSKRTTQDKKKPKSKNPVKSKLSTKSKKKPKK